MILTPIAPQELIQTIVDELKKELQQFIPQSSRKETTQEEEYYTNKEACDYLKCSSVKLWRLRKDGAIPFKKCGRTILIKKEDLKSYLSNKTKEGGQDD